MKKIDQLNLFIDINHMINEFKASIIEAKKTNNSSRINHILAGKIGEKVQELEKVSPNQAKMFDKQMDDIFKGKL